MQTNRPLEMAHDFVENTLKSVFLTGKAGTGKTTFLQKIRRKTSKRTVVVAPTGVAAINAGGVTIHSFFQLPFGPLPPDVTIQNRRFSKKKIHIIKTLDLLIIDEISMVRADVLDAIDQVMRRFRDPSQVFGGAQVLMIGDLHQLPPVIKPDDWKLLSPHYETGYFFSSLAFGSAAPICVELTHVFRQSNKEFIAILNQVRENRVSPDSLSALNERYENAASLNIEPGVITLTTHNASADNLNDGKLSGLSNPLESFEAEVDGTFPEHAFPAEEVLLLKEGAQVMFIRNDSSTKKAYYNGKIGTVVDLDEDEIQVQCEGEANPIVVGRERWENISYTLNEETKEIEEEILGSFTQFPLRLAWAITIHKSQGLTFEKVVIDAAASFAHGQTYVALSRCKSLEGITLTSRISPSAIICDSSVNRFTRDMEENLPGDDTLELAKQACQLTLMEELFDWAPLMDAMQKTASTLRYQGKTVQGSLPEVLETILSGPMPELLRISETFQRQMTASNEVPEASEAIQGRIKNGCAYFIDRLEKEIQTPLSGASFASDNQSVEALGEEALAKILAQVTMKRTCLEGCQDGFRVKRYLATRAKALLASENAGKEKKQKRVKNLESENPELFKTLQAWRTRQAEEEDIPPSRVATLASLVAISNELPPTKTRLKSIHGMGATRVKKYGDALLEMVAGFKKGPRPKAAKKLKGTGGVQQELL